MKQNKVFYSLFYYCTPHLNFLRRFVYSLYNFWSLSIFITCPGILKVWNNVNILGFYTSHLNDCENKIIYWLYFAFLTLSNLTLIIIIFYIFLSLSVSFPFSFCLYVFFNSISRSLPVSLSFSLFVCLSSQLWGCLSLSISFFVSVCLSVCSLFISLSFTIFL